MPLKPGDTVERYVVLGLLGEGGMGQVYRARDTRLQRLVALKILHSTEADGSPATTGGGARILREARAAAALEHPNVVAIHDVGEVDGPASGERVAYLAMELIRGKSLRQIMNGGNIPMPERVRWLGDVARALCAAHAVGLIHRDVKPENVMIREDGAVKVLDFGIAKRSYPRVDFASTTEAQILPSLASEGLRVGTPYYMAPEQMRGEALDGRVDQFSWAVVAYELLSGKPVWGVDIDALQLVSAVLSRDPAPLESVAENVAVEVGAVVARAMAKRPGDRFLSMEDLLAAFEGRTLDAAPRSLSPRAITGALAPPSSVSPASSTIGPGAAVPFPPAVPIVEAPANAASRAPRRALITGAVATVLALAAGLAIWARSYGPHVDTRADAAPVARQCVSSMACMKSLGGAPARCREDGVCVALASEDCEVRADPAAIGDDDTVWFGTILPPKDDPEVNGDNELRAVELARQDFDQTMSGFANHRAGQARRFGLVACSNKASPTRAARHLTDDVRVPAVIGFRSSAELVDVASSLLIPNGVLAVVSLTTNPMVTTVPSPDGEPRLIWRSTFNWMDVAKAMGAFVPDLIEPQVRGQRGSVNPNQAIRVALLRIKMRGAASMTDAIFGALRFNGRPALENGSNYRDFVFDESVPQVDDEAHRLVLALDQFAPHVILLYGDEIVGEKVVVPLEKAWSHAAYRPRWLTPLVTDAAMKWMGTDLGKRQRFFGVAPVSSTSVNARFVMHFNESSPTKVTRADAPNASYDAFYLLAYATYALGDLPVTGANLARAFARLVPPGKKVEVGPAGIFDAYATLRRGENIDLDGAYGSLDFDLATGEVPFDEALLCVGLDDTGRAAENVESGVVYRSATNKLEGTLHCP